MTSNSTFSEADIVRDAGGRFDEHLRSEPETRLPIAFTGDRDIHDARLHLLELGQHDSWGTSLYPAALDVLHVAAPDQAARLDFYYDDENDCLQFEAARDDQGELLEVTDEQEDALLWAGWHFCHGPEQARAAGFAGNDIDLHLALKESA